MFLLENKNKRTSVILSFKSDYFHNSFEDKKKTIDEIWYKYLYIEKPVHL